VRQCGNYEVNLRMDWEPVYSSDECCRCCILQLDDCVVINFMQSQQTVIKLCFWIPVDDDEVHGLPLSAVAEQVGMTWAASTCMERIQQCPRSARQVKARLLDSRITYKMLVHHRSQQSVFFLLCLYVDRGCV